MDWLPAIKLALAFIILVFASREDWRTREASDSYWLLLGTVGIILVGYQIVSYAPDPLYMLFLIPLAVLFYDIFWNRAGFLDNGLNLPATMAYAAAIISVAILLIQFQTSSFLWRLLIIPIMILVFILFYQFDIIKGGADAKALIALSILFPIYPIIGPFPLIVIPTELAQYVFPFSLLVLFNAALIMLVLPISFFVVNVVRGDVKFPAMFFGYKMSIADARCKFVWPMERLENGRRRISLMPKEEGSDCQVLDELEKDGDQTVWVTPKVPFLIPITISLVVSAIIGNPLFFFFAR